MILGIFLEVLGGSPWFSGGFCALIFIEIGGLGGFDVFSCLWWISMVLACPWWFLVILGG